MKYLIWFGTIVLLFFFFCLKLVPWLEAANRFDGPSYEPLSNIPCVSYTPFRGDEAPWQFEAGLQIPLEHFRDDLAVLQKEGTRCVRTYSVTGLDGFFPLARESGFEVWLGIWIGGDDAANERELAKARSVIAEYRDIVRLVIVGNEVLLRHEQPANALTRYIRRVKEFAPGLTVTYADVWEFWQKNPDVAEAVDLVMIHILPYWENDPLPVAAVSEHLTRIHDGVAAQFAPKPIALGEVGWPSRGRSREAAVAGLIQQYQFTQAALTLCRQNGWLCNFVEAFDQPWKRRQEGGVGGAWGLWDEARHFKLRPPLYVPESQLEFCVFGILAGLAVSLVWLAVFGRRLTLARGLASLAVILLVGTVSAFTLSDYLFYVRGFTEGLRYFLFWLWPLLLGVVTLWFFKAPDVVRTGSRPRFVVRFLVFGYFLILLVTSFEMIFDGRYRFFPNGTVVLPTAFLALWRWQKIQLPTLPNFVLMLVLGSCAVMLLFFEKITNRQAVFFVLQIGAVFLLFRLPTPRKSDGWVVAELLLLAVGGYALRVFWLNSAEFGQTCADQPGLWHCRIRSVVGFMIHFQLWGILALAATFVQMLIRAAWVRRLALAAGILAIAFYNVNEGALALAVLLLTLSGAKFKTGTRPAPSAFFR